MSSKGLRDSDIEISDEVGEIDVSEAHYFSKPYFNRCGFPEILVSSASPCVVAIPNTDLDIMIFFRLYEVVFLVCVRLVCCCCFVSLILKRRVDRQSWRRQPLIWQADQ